MPGTGGRRSIQGAAVILATLSLGVISILGTAGYICLAVTGRPIPEALIAVTSGAVGSLAGLVSVVLVVRGGNGDVSHTEIRLDGAKKETT